MNKRQHQWTYKQHGSEVVIGPVSESQFVELVKNGTITGSTLVRSSTRTKNKWIAPKRIPAVAKFIKQPNRPPSSNSRHPTNSRPTYKEVVAATGPTGDPTTASSAAQFSDQPRPTNSIENFKPLDSTVVTWLLRATMLVMVINGLCVYCFFQLTRTQLPAIAMAQAGVSFAQTILYITTGIFFLRWKYQAYANLQASRILPLTTSAGWIIAHYFIPIVTAYRPALVMNEIQSCSKARIGKLVLSWWILLMLANIPATLSMLVADSDEKESHLLSFVAICLTISAGCFLLKIIRTVTDQQRQYGLWLEEQKRQSNNTLALCSIDTWQQTQLADQYEPLDSTAVTGLLRATMVAMAINALIIFYLTLWSPLELPATERLQSHALVIQIILYSITGVFFLNWKYQAYANLQAVRTLPLKTTAGWSVAHYFIPFVNMYRPGFVIYEILSRCKANIGASVEAWWTLLILASIFANVAMLVPSLDGEGGRLLSLVSICMTISAGYLLLKIIGTITEKQRRYGLWLEKQEQRSNKKLAFFSIDRWQDPQPVVGATLDNPILGVSVMCCVTTSLLVWYGLSSPSEISDQRRLLADRRQPPAIRPDTSLGNNDARPKQDISALLSELLKSNGKGHWIRHQLSIHGCDDTEVTLRLASLLSETDDARKFENIARHMLALDTSRDRPNDPDVKRQVVNALAKAGQHVQTAQLKKMDTRLLRWILIKMPLPEGADLLTKLGSTGSEWEPHVLERLSHSKSNLTTEISINIARETNKPEILRDKESDLVCQFLWEGKLAGKAKFSRMNVGFSEASIKAFSNVVAAQLDNDPSVAVDSLMACWRPTDDNVRIHRESLPTELLQRIDEALAANVKKHLRLKNASIGTLRNHGRRKGTGPFAFLELAAHLGGKKTVVAIAKLGKSKPSILKNFSPIHDLLLTVNEPETYDAIAVTAAYHHKSESTAISENIGQAIEASFLRQLQLELKSQPPPLPPTAKRYDRKTSDWKRRIGNLVEVIQEIGTADSLSAFEELAKSKDIFIQNTATISQSKIRSRMTRD